MLEEISCPCCGEPTTVEIDRSGGNDQELVSDCEVCCRPMVVRVRLRGGEVVTLSATAEGEG